MRAISVVFALALFANLVSAGLFARSPQDLATEDPDFNTNIFQSTSSASIESASLDDCDEDGNPIKGASDCGSSDDSDGKGGKDGTGKKKEKGDHTDLELG